MTLTSSIQLAAGDTAGDVSPYLIGAVTLAILVACMVALLAFGKGREHS